MVAAASKARRRRGHRLHSSAAGPAVAGPALSAPPRKLLLQAADEHHRPIRRRVDAVRGEHPRGALAAMPHTSDGQPGVYLAVPVHSFTIGQRPAVAPTVRRFPPTAVVDRCRITRQALASATYVLARAVFPFRVPSRTQARKHARANTRKHTTCMPRHGRHSWVKFLVDIRSWATYVRT